MIKIKIPRFSYKEEKILQDIDLTVEAGQTYGVIGLNGAGKTTFFNLMAGYLKGDDCTFLKNDQPLKRKEIAFVDTDLFIYSKLTAREFLSVFPQANNFYDEKKLAELFRIPLDDFTEEYSTGMKKKLLLLSQLKQDKDLYILDEPFNGLDLETNRMLEVIISKLNERGKTVFLSSHILAPLLSVCDKIFYLKEKTVIKTYHKSEFSEIEDALFGNYTRELEAQLKGII